ncbi:putative transcriptional regulator [Gottschalkia purinilytica]|uniref:Putative transcriptional regulator n=1 Tax=Gottschalkia purinilytica TaxID=1503 RepID=A0A0L0WAL0_GOTPU|nr:helix-turn-helix domain-containing protein [Gottschalkia purinilytica]KNF08526.1 putative transcriptional regulator [Gottschalkia purinilytica]
MRLNLKKAREKKKLTQSEIAKKIGIARTTYTNIERGDKNPSFLVALKIKEILNTESDDIFLSRNVPKGN